MIIFITLWHGYHYLVKDVYTNHVHDYPKKWTCGPLRYEPVISSVVIIGFQCCWYEEISSILELRWHQIDFVKKVVCMGELPKMLKLQNPLLAIQLSTPYSDVTSLAYNHISHLHFKGSTLVCKLK